VHSQDQVVSGPAVDCADVGAEMHLDTLIVHILQNSGGDIGILAAGELPRATVAAKAGGAFATPRPSRHRACRLP
jgi:hypothetical protein